MCLQQISCKIKQLPPHPPFFLFLFQGVVERKIAIKRSELFYLCQDKRLKIKVEKWQKDRYDTKYIHFKNAK